jgi:ABC-2 type transport system permease protein
VAATLALGAGATSVVSCTAEGCGGDSPKLSLVGVQLGQALVAALGVLVIGAEHGSGMLGTTLAAMPRRMVVLAAKAVTLTGAVVAAGSVAVLASVLAAQRILAHRGVASISLTDGPTLRAMVGSVLYLVLVALLALGVATAVRSPAASIGITLALLYLLPILAQAIGDEHWQRRVDELGPANGALAVQTTVDVDHLPRSPWAALAVTAGWAAGALVLGGVLLQARDP